MYLAYPNHLVDFRASWTRADGSFNPEGGYVRRSAYQRFGSEFVIFRRPRLLPFVQLLEFKPWEVSYYRDDLTADVQSFDGELVPPALTTRTGEPMEFAVTRRAENLGEPFKLLEDAAIPAGEYRYTRWLLEVSSFSAGKLSGGGDRVGGILSGKKTSASPPPPAGR